MLLRSQEFCSVIFLTRFSGCCHTVQVVHVCTNTVFTSSVKLPTGANSVVSLPQVEDSSCPSGVLHPGVS